MTQGTACLLPYTLSLCPFLPPSLFWFSEARCHVAHCPVQKLTWQRKKEPVRKWILPITTWVRELGRRSFSSQAQKSLQPADPWLQVCETLVSHRTQLSFAWINGHRNRKIINIILSHWGLSKFVMLRYIIDKQIK